MDAIINQDNNLFEPWKTKFSLFSQFGDWKFENYHYTQYFLIFYMKYHNNKSLLPNVLEN